MSTNDKRNRNEEMFDHMIEYGTSEWAEDISPDDIPEEELSDELNKKMDNMFTSARKKANRKRRFITARRIAAVFVVLLTMASITVMSVDAFREPVLNFIFKTSDKENKTRMNMTEIPATSTEIEFVFHYMPEGYVFEKKVIDKSNTNITYQYNNKDSIILIDIIFEPSANVYKYIEDQDYKSIKTTDTEYFYIKGSYNQLIWSKGKTIYTIFSNLKSDTMIRIGKNIERKN